MELKEFRKKYKNDDNIIWRLSSGELQSLIDQAIECIENFESNGEANINKNDIEFIRKQKVNKNVLQK